MSVEHVKKTIQMSCFIKRHKENLGDFTRKCKLTFTNVFLLIFRNSAKSLQLMLNELTLERNLNFTITAGAFTKARKKLKHTAFIELYENLKEIYYKENDTKKLYGFRIIGFDGSDLILPNTPKIRTEFGSIKTANGVHKDTGDYAKAKLEIGYDVLNNYVIACKLEHGKSCEKELASSLLGETNSKDLLVFDRAYASYQFICNLLNNKKNFLSRCPVKSFSATHGLLEKKNKGLFSNVVILKMPSHLRKKAKDLNLPLSIKVRFVKVILSTGETEILVTSLLDEVKYPENIFKDLYYLRWGIETFFSKIKGRCSLEHFTGKTVESVRQELWSTIMISNLETVMTEDIDSETVTQCIEKGTSIKKTNKAVSFNLIKNKAIDLFTSKLPTEQILEQLTELFKMNMNIVRVDREVERVKISFTRSRNYQKRQRKQVF